MAGNFISFGGGKKNEWQDIIGTMPSTTGEQAAVSTPLSEYLAEALAGLGEGEATFEDWSKGNVPDVFGGQLGKQAMGVYSEAMEGAFPEQYFKEAIYNPTMTEWQQDIMPSIKESYVGTGAITGTEVGDRIAREAGRLQQGLVGTRAELAQQQKARGLQAAGEYTQAYQQNLALAYDDYIKRNPAASELLQAALAYLNIPMMAAYQKPAEMATGAVTTKDEVDKYANYKGNVWGKVFLPDDTGGSYR